MEGQLIIVANKNAFKPISKLLATIIDDTLTLKENLLIPSKSGRYNDNSFVIHHHHTIINVVLAEPGHTLPVFLIEPHPKESTLHLFQINEEDAQIHLEPLAKHYEIELSYTPLTQGWIKVVCNHTKYDQIEAFQKDVKALLPTQVIVSDNIFAHLIQRFSSLGRSITFAESCTGGLIAAQLTSEPGSSSIFKGSLVTYANSLKEGWLGVEKEVLERFGAVSSACVKQMLTGAKEITQADYALAVSGIAGPGGATPQKPVGTVFIGAKSDKKTIVEELHFEGDRQYVQQQSMLYAYKLLFQIASDDLF